VRKPEQDSAAMSVIIDDRADVWEEASRKSLLQVRCLKLHCAFVSMCTACVMHESLLRMNSRSELAVCEVAVVLCSPFHFQQLFFAFLFIFRIGHPGPVLHIPDTLQDLLPSVPEPFLRQHCIRHYCTLLKHVPACCCRRRRRCCCCFLFALLLHSPLQVMPFHPHKEAAALEMGPSAPAAEYTAARDSEAELARVASTLRELRSRFYAELDLVSGPAACNSSKCLVVLLYGCSLHSFGRVEAACTV
jgi:hypothetical protein